MKLPVHEEEQRRQMEKPELMRQRHVLLDVDLVEGNIAMQSRIIGQQSFPVPARGASRRVEQNQCRATSITDAVMEIELVQCCDGIHC